jgi:hypothetical protein
MNTATKPGAFALGLGAVFGMAYGVGQTAGPGTGAQGASTAEHGQPGPGHN